MSWLKKDPHSIRSPAGWEWAIWKKLPWIWAVGTALPLVLAGATWLFYPEQPDGARDPGVMRFEFIMIGVVVQGARGRSGQFGILIQRSSSSMSIG